MRTNSTIFILSCLLSCTNSFSQTLWKQLPLLQSSQEYKFIDFADSLNGWIFSDSGAYAKTTNGGKNWESGSVALPSTVSQIKSFSNNICWVVSGAYYNIYAVFYTTNGKDWKQLAVPDSIAQRSLGSVGFSTPTRIWFPSLRGIFTSGDLGNSWTLNTRSSGMVSYIEFADSLTGYLESETSGPSGETYGSTFRTNDAGTNWDTLSFESLTTYSYKFYNPLYGFCRSDWVGMDGYPHYSYLSATFDGWKTSQSIAIPDGWWTSVFGCLVYPNGKQFLLTDQNKLKSRDSDTSEFYITTDTSGISIVAFESVSENDNWILASSNRLFQSVGVPTRVNNLQLNAPNRIQLEPNYPNPFNPSTTIAFDLSQAADVQISVFDDLGREISTILSQREASGHHIVNFNAANLTSGVYFCRLTSDGYTFTRKMLLVK
jgi:Secretion system C-terminal sorting domain